MSSYPEVESIEEADVVVCSEKEFESFRKEQIESKLQFLMVIPEGDSFKEETETILSSFGFAADSTSDNFYKKNLVKELLNEIQWLMNMTVVPS